MPVFGRNVNPLAANSAWSRTPTEVSFKNILFNKAANLDGTLNADDRPGTQELSSGARNPLDGYQAGSTPRYPYIGRSPTRQAHPLHAYSQDQSCSTAPSILKQPFGNAKYYHDLHCVQTPRPLPGSRNPQRPPARRLVVHFDDVVEPPPSVSSSLTTSGSEYSMSSWAESAVSTEATTVGGDLPVHPFSMAEPLAVVKEVGANLNQLKEPSCEEMASPKRGFKNFFKFDALSRVFSRVTKKAKVT
ncbi:Phosphoglycerate mutase-like protein [Mycena chlorophos]|uniref:Phosphoglycerate mutase-like protein n=1 Tax=Mycena chlorophos TaxID=658473 RepID=A0A8H6TTC9_MYCCL|nr:Phosphoglycerate mutase-like protein [Mycena chlorophos]